MTNVFQSLLLVIATATQKELARQVKYLKVENELLRGMLPKRLTITAKQKSRLVRFAQKLTAKVLRQLTTIVAPDTLLKWIRAEKKGGKQTPVKRGRPRTPEQIRRLVVKLAKENQWGLTRMLGELKKLGIVSIARNTVKRILQAAGYDPAPQRGEGTWDEFIKTHAASLWQCDFFSKRILTIKGFRDVFVLAFLNVKTRQVILSPATLHPDEEWVVAQAESFVQQARQQGLRVKYVQRDRDCKFTRSFDRKLKSLRVKAIKNAYAFVERFIQAIQQECLDRFVIFGERHMDHVCAEYLAHYLTERPHQGAGIDNQLLQRTKQRGRPKRKHGPLAEQVVPLSEVRCQQRLGGLLKSYRRQAA